MTFLQENLVGRPDRVRTIFESGGVVFNGRPRRGEHRVLCPFHVDREHPSMDVALDRAVYLCRTCKVGGDAVEFYARTHALSIEDALRELRSLLQLNGDSSARRVVGTTTWEIRDARGTVVALHERTDYDSTPKGYSWARPDGSAGLGGLPVADLPLYGSQRIPTWHRDAPIILTEGEKAADTLIERGFCALGTITGAGSTPSAAALEVLRDRDVVLWPDHDQPGRGHMRRIAEGLSGTARSVRTLEWGERPKDDAADFFARGGTEDQLDRILADAKPARSNSLEPPAKAASPPPDSGTALISRSLLELAQNPPPPVRFIVEPLLAIAVLGLLFGKAFGGKSLFALQLGLHAAAALEFLQTFRFPRPLRVLYLDEEMGLPLLCGRIEKMKSGRAEFREPDVLKRFRVVSRAGLRLDDPKKLDLIRREIGEFPGGPPDLAFLDTFRRMHRLEEKDSGEMARLMETCVSLVEQFETTLVPIHHSKKGPNDEEGDWREAARGSGDLVAASQAVIALWKSAELLFSLRADVKAAGEIQPFPLLLDPATLLYQRQSDDERLATKEKQKESAINEATSELCRSLRKLKERDGASYPPSWTAWRDASTGNRDTLASARDALVEAGTVRKTPRQGRGGGDAYLFSEDAPRVAQ